MASKSSVRDPNEVYDESKSKIDFYKVQNQINDAYRSSDLDAIDSLSQLTYVTKNTQKYLIVDRNVILAHNIDSVSKTVVYLQVLEQLIYQGKTVLLNYFAKWDIKVRPVSNIATKKGIKQKIKLKPSLKKWPAKSSFLKTLFSYDVYDEPVNIANMKGYSFSLTTDMANGSYTLLFDNKLMLL